VTPYRLAACDRPQAPCQAAPETIILDPFVNVLNSYFQIVRDLLVQKIAEGALPDGMRLYEAALADRLSVSRSPVKRALDLPAQDGIVDRDGARGYIFGTRTPRDMLRPNLHMLDLTLPGKDSAAIIAPS
jgi:DNA-binding FadR family transcriptional regulator